MLKFGQRVFLVLTATVLLWASVAGAIGRAVVASTGGAGVIAGAKVVSSDAPAGRAKVLIIGDSVFDAFDHVASARQMLENQQKIIFAVQGCQKLMEPGCMKWVKLSALDQLKKNAGKFSDVVIGTGYNDRIGTPFREAVLAITNEAASQVRFLISLGSTPLMLHAMACVL